MSAFEVDGKAIEQVLQVTLNLLDECSWPLRGINCLAKLYDISHEDDYKRYDGQAKELLSWLGNAWHAENIRSVNCRYKENGTAEPLKFDFGNAQINLWRYTGVKHESDATVQAVKTLDSLEYQSCETRDYFSTWQHRALEGIRGTLALELVRHFPAYEDALW